MRITTMLQQLGRSLQLPIAVLPIAALLLRIGRDDLLNSHILEAAGASIFDHLPLLFSLGVATALSLNHAGEAALAGGVGYLLLTSILETACPGANMGALSGILTGIIAACVYNRYYNVVLPDFLAFFGGKRSVPIITGVFCSLLAWAFIWIWPPVQALIETLGDLLLASGWKGAAAFGLLNRLLLPFGLHQIINNYAWYELGSFEKDGRNFEGDMERFYAGDLSAGHFMAGFYPIMMFALPAACLAFYYTVPKERRGEIGGMLGSIACTAIFTGITEPIEFSFVFLAPSLYFLHALLTGASLGLSTYLGIHAGFSFSAGLVDYLLMYSLPAAQKPLLLLLLGAAFAALYYLLFRTLILRYNLSTPGRGVPEEAAAPLPSQDPSPKTETGAPDQKAAAYLSALGGSENILDLEACITRLRVVVRTMDAVNEGQLKSLGANGVIQLDDNNLQVVVGTKASLLCEALRALQADENEKRSQ